jgi:hypothetical protein
VGGKGEIRSVGGGAREWIGGGEEMSDERASGGGRFRGWWGFGVVRSARRGAASAEKKRRLGYSPAG